MFKDKIIAAIKAKFPGVNLSKKRLEAIAAVIEKEVIDDEGKIDASLDAFNKYNPVADIAKQDDTLRDLDNKVKAAAKADPTKKTETPPAKDEPVVDDGTPGWAKTLIESHKTISEKLSKLEGEKVVSSIRTKATERLNEKGKEVPVGYWGKRALPEKEEDLEAFITEVQTDYSAFQKELTESGLSRTPGPRAPSAGPTGKDKQATKEEVAAVVKDIM